MWQINQVVLLFLIYFQGSLGVEVCGTPEGNELVCELITVVRDIIKNGSSELGIPILDPLEIADIPLDLTSDTLSGNVRFQNLSVHNLSLFDVSEAKFNVLVPPVVIGLDFNPLQLKTSYDGQLKIMDMINLFGKGDILLKISNLSLKLQFKLQIFRIKIVEAKIILNSAPEISATFTGLFNDEFMSKIISTQFTDTANTLLEEKLDALNALLAKIVQELVDKFVNPILPNKVANRSQLTNEDIKEIVMDIFKELVHLNTKLLL